MINIPEGFAAIKGYPGYFWNVTEEQLYSMKITGVLTPLRKQKAFNRPWDPIPAGWRVSKAGVKRLLTDEWIKRRLVFNAEIPTQYNGA